MPIFSPEEEELFTEIEDNETGSDMDGEFSPALDIAEPDMEELEELEEPEEPGEPESLMVDLGEMEPTEPEPT